MALDWVRIQKVAAATLRKELPKQHDGYEHGDEDDKDDVIWPGSKSWDDTRAGNDDASPQSLLGCILLS